MTDAVGPGKSLPQSDMIASRIRSMHLVIPAVWQRGNGVGDTPHRVFVLDLVGRHYWRWTAKSWKVEDGSAVLEAAQRLQPDVTVVDLNLPNVNGLEARRQITQGNAVAKAIVFTAMNDPPSGNDPSRSERLPLCSKGTGGGDLLSTVKRMCDDRGRLNRSMPFALALHRADRDHP